TGRIVVTGNQSFSSPPSGVTTRFVWSGDGLKFQAGNYMPDISEMGATSFSFGHGSKATGPGSFACGVYPPASGDYSMAFGWPSDLSGPKSLGNLSLAFGGDITASGVSSFAFGQFSASAGLHSTLFGRNSSATGDYAFVSGLNNSASGAYSA